MEEGKILLRILYLGQNDKYTNICYFNVYIMLFKNR